MREIAFIDVTCPKPYDDKSLEKEPLGGTEATVIRVAEALKERFNVKVIQHNRHEQSGIYYPFSHVAELKNPQAIVALRDPKVLPFVDQMYRDAKKILWMHDLAGQDFGMHVELLNDVKPHVIGVSDFHKTQIIDVAKAFSREVQFTVGHIYNPVVAEPDPRANLDESKFLFMSSPHKGLREVARSFALVAQHIPNAKLYVANPGYLPSLDLDKDYIVKLGELTHSEVLRHLQESYALFYPNPDIQTAETFGIVVAEAQALGTPCILSRHGALPEIVKDDEQFVNPRNPVEAVKRIQKWKKDGRPEVSLKIEAGIERTADKWAEVLR